MLSTFSINLSERKARFSCRDRSILFRPGIRGDRSGLSVLLPTSFRRIISAPEYSKPVNSGGSGERSRVGDPSANVQQQRIDLIKGNEIVTGH